jgi:LPXTG-motif cell wall-anchored protein
MKTRLAALLILMSFVLPPVAAAATGGPVFGLRAVGNPKRGYFIYEIAPGAAHTGAVIVSNTGNRTGTVKLFSADGSTGQTTGTVYLTDSKPVRAGAWLKLAQPSVKLAPGEIKRVPFTVRVPSSHVGPGQWVAGIVAETSASAKTKRSTRKAGVQIRIRNQTIVAVQVNVPGQLSAAFTIGGVKPGGQRGFQQVLVHFSNDGNMLVKPTGSVTILQGGKAIEQLPFKMDTFLPQTSIDYPVLLKKALAAGEYQTKVSLSYPTPAGGRKTITASPTLKISDENVKQVFTSAAPQKPPVGSGATDAGSSTPWALIGGIAAAMLLLLLVLWLLLRRRRRGDDDDELEVDEPPRQVLPPPAPAAPARAEQPVTPVEPAPPVAPTPAPPIEQAPPAAPAAPAAVARPASPACDPHHYWEVAYERGALGDDGVWRFPHRCQNCGLELLATDIADANAQAEQLVH